MGWTPLFFACKKGDKQMVEYLIEHNAKVTESTPLGDNCLKIAQKHNHQEIALLLVSKGTSIFLNILIKANLFLRCVAKK